MMRDRVKKLEVLSFLLFSFLLIVHNSKSAPSHQENEESSEGVFSGKTGVLLLSVGVLTTLILTAGICGFSYCRRCWGWVKRNFWRKENPDWPPEPRRDVDSAEVFFQTTSFRESPYEIITFNQIGDGTRTPSLSSSSDGSPTISRRPPSTDTTKWDEISFPREKITIFGKFGNGWFGPVLDAEAEGIVPFELKTRVVLKQLREMETSINQKKFLDQCLMFKDLTHSNIIKVLGVNVEALPIYVIFEGSGRGDLKRYLLANADRGKILAANGNLIRMAMDVAIGLEYLGIKGFVHPDLAARNCQIKTDGGVVIGDYGLGPQTYKDDYHQGTDGTLIPLRWMPPEAVFVSKNNISIINSKCKRSSNVWTYGILLWEIWEFGKRPYPNFTNEEVIQRVVIEKIPASLPDPSFIENDPLGEKINAIISSCTHILPEKRPPPQKIIGSLEEFLRDVLLLATFDNYI